MRIDPTSGQPTAGRVSKSDVIPKGATTTSPAGTTKSADIQAFTPTADLANLLAAVRQSPEVREDVVQATAAKLDSGELTTPAAALATAHAVLDDNSPIG